MKHHAMNNPEPSASSSEDNIDFHNSVDIEFSANILFHKVLMYS